MKNKVITAGFVLLLVIFMGGGLLYTLLPYVADTYLLPRIARDLPFDQKKLSLTQITPWRMQGSLAFAHRGQKNISIANIEAVYSPASLLEGRIVSITLDSILLHLYKTGNGLILPGLEQFSSDTHATEDMVLPELPFQVEKIRLKNAIIVVHGDDQTLQLMVNGVVMPAYEHFSSFAYHLSALKMDFHTDGFVDLEGSVAAVQEEKGHNISVDLKMRDIGQPFSSINFLSNERPTGEMTLQAKIDTEGMRSISGYDIQAELRNFSFKRGGLVLQHETNEEPVVLRLKGDMQQADYEVAGLGGIQPEKITLHLNGQYSLTENEVRGNVVLLPVRTHAPVHVDFQGNIGEKSEINYTVEGEQSILANHIMVAPFTGAGMVHMESGTVAARLEANLPTITDTQNGITLAGISVDLPFNYPQLAPEATKPGSFSIKEIHYREENSATLKGSMNLGLDQARMSAQITSPLFTNFKLTCTGKATAPDDLELGCSFPEFKFEEKKFPHYIPLPDNFKVTGTADGEMHFAVVSGVQQGDARITVKGANISYNDLDLMGLSGSISFPKLPDITSSPSQLFTIDQIQMGKIAMSDAKIALRVDAKDEIFIEKARLNWCGGLVEASAVKLSENMQKVETTLYCDRLHYTDLLSQFGVGDAEGGGSLNGRLPVIISREGIEFDNGFLFSTPGNSGIVRFKNTKKLRQGMAGMDKTVYLDYSMDALENFSYNWTKLTFNTEGEELLLQLQLDGKPAEPLPYGYREGQIAKSAEGGGIQHPIRLDVNFRLPMRELFRYGKNIQSFMENM